MGEAERRCAVLFVDVAGSTALHSTLGEGEATRRLAALIQAISREVEAHRGTVLKSDGDDILAVFEGAPERVGDAAHAAIQIQKTASQFGLSVYAGLHDGSVTFRDVLGRRDVAGLAVNVAARLHKLTPGVAGTIFLSSESARLLPADLTARTRSYGARPLKGVGDVEISTLDWNDEDLGIATVHIGSVAEARARDLLLSYQGSTERLSEDDSPAVLGRSPNHCRIVVSDPSVSSRHVLLVLQYKIWVAKDVSRNGTWLKDAASGDELHLQGGEANLPRGGALCLGHPFGGVEASRCTLTFSLVEP